MIIFFYQKWSDTRIYAAVLTSTIPLINMMEEYI